MAARVHRRVHRSLVFERRRDRLSRAIARLLPDEPVSILDLGCGSGDVGASLADAGHAVAGVETLARPGCVIPMAVFDGARLPIGDRSVDWVTIVDVLHHAAHPAAVCSEAVRVARSGIIVKDHFAETAHQRRVLAAMDWVGNRQYGVGRDGAYLTRSEWAALWSTVGLDVEIVDEDLDLYPRSVKRVFERGLHFVARLRPIAG